MSKPTQDPRETSPLSPPDWASALFVVSLLLMIGGMTTWLALKYDALRPKIGDMIVFVRVSPDVDVWQLPVSAPAMSGRDGAAGPCVFDPQAMAAGGGSLIVESREPADPPRFRVHWAGRYTAKGHQDCGVSVDVTLDKHDLQRLANAAGGFGLRPGTIR